MYSEDVGQERVTRRVPHYAQKTITTSAPEFANHEQDVIRQSFSTGNHTWMKEALPIELAPDAVNLLRRQRMERNRLSEPVPQTWSKMTQLWGGGYYQEFEYVPDEYDRKEAFGRGLRGASTEKREKISHHDWRYSSQEKRLKHETMIKDPRNKDAYPYLGGDKDAELDPSKPIFRNAAFSGWDWSGDISRQPGVEQSFLAGRGSGLEEGSRMSRMTLPTIVQRLQRRLDEDWEGTTVVVSATEQDLVQIAFHMATVDSERGVLAYMNVLSKDVELLGSLALRKVSQLWGMRRDFTAEMQSAGKDKKDDINIGGIEGLEHVWTFFLLAPKWVKMRPTDAYYTVHPRSQGSAFRMSTAGSSVLLSLGSSVLDPTEALRKRDEKAGSQSARNMSGMSGPVDLGLVEAAVKGLPAIRENRGVHA
jgi:hypothetical protein